jgi:hypothetical protein
VVDNVIGDDAGEDSAGDVPISSYLNFMRAASRLSSANASRYCETRHERVSNLAVFERDLEERKDHRHWLGDDEFLEKYRVTRDQLHLITNLIKDSKEFGQTSIRGPLQMPVKYQLMVFLHFVGHESTTDRNQREVFVISRGRITNARIRVTKALIGLRDTYIQWPTEDERKATAERFLKKWGFVNAVFIMDGTLLEIAFEPQSDDFSDYHGRKYRYSLTVLVMNNDKKEILYYLSGFPGSAHDNRVWKNTPQCRNPTKYFSPTEYGLADTAFSPSTHCIPSYKCVTGINLPEDEAHFNSALSSPRVTSEHTIGIWKGRFGYLRKIRMKITNDPRSLKKILEMIDATVVLHNILMRNNDPVNIKRWMDELEDDEFSAMDDPTRAPEEEVLHMSIPRGAPEGTRREQLKVFFRETWVQTCNYMSGENNTTGKNGDDDSIDTFGFGH